MRRLEIETLEELDQLLDSNADLTGAVFQSLDLTGHGPALRGAALHHNVLLGCTTSPEVLALFEDPIIFPQLPALPFDPFRGALYSPDELLGGYEIGDGPSYGSTVDGRCYQHFVDNDHAGSEEVMVTLARRLHDHGISDALQEFLRGRKVVAIMGGHSLGRDDPMYLEVARLAGDLVRAGFLPTSGGGPGAMEATHLGAWFAERPDDELRDAVGILATAPKYDPRDPWLDTAFTVAERYPLPSIDGSRSLGIPTWHYGHEPPARFATDIAKYFANSVREEGLLAIAHHGVVFAPGSAGTIQEIFQDAAQNHYESFGMASPMVFLGEEYWTVRKPVYPLMKVLAEGRPYARWLSITDSRGTVMDRLRAFDATLARGEAP
ncbi:MAG: hypothetical protein AAGN66_08160 [Acidobacteriota bacterium]